MRYTLPEKFFCLHWCLFIEEEGKQLQHISTGLQDEEDFQHSEKDDQLVDHSKIIITFTVSFNFLYFLLYSYLAGMPIRSFYYLCTYSGLKIEK